MLCICTGFPSTLPVFLSTAVGAGDFGVVLLSDDSELEHDSERLQLLAGFDDDKGRPLVKLVIGDVLDRRHLRRAGVAHAHAVCIFSAAGEETNMSVDDCDRHTTLAYAKVHDLMMCEGASAPLIAELHSAQAIRFLDPTLWWPSGESKLSHVHAPAFASGHCFAASMLHPLVGYSYFMPTMISLLDNVLHVQDWISQDTLQAGAQLADEITAGKEGLLLWPIPDELHGQSFESLFYTMQASICSIWNIWSTPMPHTVTYVRTISATQAFGSPISLSMGGAPTIAWPTLVLGEV